MRAPSYVHDGARMKRTLDRTPDRTTTAARARAHAFGLARRRSFSDWDVRSQSSPFAPANRPNIFISSHTQSPRDDDCCWSTFGVRDRRRCRLVRVNTSVCVCACTLAGCCACGNARACVHQTSGRVLYRARADLVDSGADDVASAARHFRVGATICNSVNNYTE